MSSQESGGRFASLSAECDDLLLPPEQFEDAPEGNEMDTTSKVTDTCCTRDAVWPPGCDKSISRQTTCESFVTAVSDLGPASPQMSDDSVLIPLSSAADNHHDVSHNDKNEPQRSNPGAAPSGDLLRAASVTFRTVQKAQMRDNAAGSLTSASSLESNGSSEFGASDFIGEPPPSQRLRPSPLSSEVIQRSSGEWFDSEQEPSTPCTPIRRINSQYVNEYIERTETMQLHVLVHEMLRIEVTELLKEKSELAKRMQKLEKKEKLLMAEILKAENLLGEEVLQDDLVAGMPEDEKLELGETGFDGLVEQYRSLLDGYHASKMQKTTVDAVAAYAAMLSGAPQAPLRDVLDANCKWVKSHGWHLAGSHQGNSSQLYRLLAEEVGELLTELERDADRAAHELGDVMAYVMQFIWEFHLQKQFPPSPTAPRKRWAHLDKSFAQLQILKAEELAATAGDGSGRGGDGRIRVRDVLLRLHRCLLSLASSLRTVNGDHQRFQGASNWEKRSGLAKDLDMLLESLAEVTVAYQIRLHDRADTDWLYSGALAEKPVRWVQSYQCQNKACGKQKQHPSKPLCQGCARANQCQQCGDQKKLLPDPDSSEPCLNGGGRIAPQPLCNACVEAGVCKGCGKKGLKERPEEDVFCPACKASLACACGEMKRDPSHAVCAKCHSNRCKSMDAGGAKGKGSPGNGASSNGSSPTKSTAPWVTVSGKGSQQGSRPSSARKKKQQQQQH